GNHRSFARRACCRHGRGQRIRWLKVTLTATKVCSLSHPARVYPSWLSRSVKSDESDFDGERVGVMGAVPGISKTLTRIASSMRSELSHTGEVKRPRFNQESSRLIVERRRRHEAAEFALDQFGQSQRRAILQPRADDLDAHRQAVLRKSGRDRSCRQAR